MKKDFKEKISQRIAQRNLCSYMNDTKWNELRTAVKNEMPFPPPFILKTVFEDVCREEESFRQDVTYWGDWDEGLQHGHGYIALEWIKVRSRYLKYRGRLMEPEMIDASEKFEEILKRYQIPYEMENGMYCIYGYK